MRDPAASLSLFPVEFTLAGKDYELPGVGARWWLEMLLANDIGMIVAAEPEGLLSVQEAAEIDLALIDGTVEMEEFRAVLYDVLSAVAGRDWWEAVGLVATVSSEANWSRIMGQLFRSMPDPGALPLAAWLDAVLSICTQNMDEKQLGKFMGHLQTPPVEVGIDEDREAANFLAMLGPS